MSKKKTYRVLAYCDSPVAETGFAQVAKQIFWALKKDPEIDYEITIAAINHIAPYYDQTVYPFRIFMPLSEKDNLAKNLFRQMLLQTEYDIVFTFNDLAIISQFIPVIEEARKSKKFIWVTYSPVDRDNMDKEQVQPFGRADVSVTYTNWGKDVSVEADEYLKTKLQVAYHGTEPELFKLVDRSLADQWRKDHFNVDKDTFFVLNVNRNQWRKDLVRTMMAFKLFKEQVLAKDKKAKLVLYLHSRVDDWGGNLLTQSKAAGLELGEDIIFSQIQDAGLGIPRDKMNIIYNAADVVVSTTVGEGWGLSTTEAMCAQKPVIMPRNTSLVEIVGSAEERGYLAEAGGLSLQTVFYGSQNWSRPLVDIESMVEKLHVVYNDWKKARDYTGTKTGEKIEWARDWATKIPWDSVIHEQWRDIFRRAVKRFNRKR